MMSGRDGRLTVTFVSRPRSTGVGFTALYSFVTGPLRASFSSRSFIYFTATTIYVPRTKRRIRKDRKTTCNAEVNENMQDANKAEYAVDSSTIGRSTINSFSAVSYTHLTLPTILRV